MVPPQASDHVEAEIEIGIDKAGQPDIEIVTHKIVGIVAIAIGRKLAGGSSGIAGGDVRPVPQFHAEVVGKVELGVAQRGCRLDRELAGEVVKLSLITTLSSST
jgi:hypothetical protein